LCRPAFGRPFRSAAAPLQGWEIPLTLEGILRYREVEDEVKGTAFKHRLSEIHAISMKRLSKIEAVDDPSDGADDE
jgi:hypothetical protein